MPINVIHMYFVGRTPGWRGWFWWGMVGYSKCFYTGRLRPEGQTLNFHTSFLAEKVLSIENATPFTYLQKDYYCLFSYFLT